MTKEILFPFPNPTSAFAWRVEPTDNVQLIERLTFQHNGLGPRVDGGIRIAAEIQFADMADCVDAGISALCSIIQADPARASNRGLIETLRRILGNAALTRMLDSVESNLGGELADAASKQTPPATGPASGGDPMRVPVNAGVTQSHCITIFCGKDVRLARDLWCDFVETSDGRTLSDVLNGYVLRVEGSVRFVPGMVGIKFVGVRPAWFEAMP